MKLIIITAVSQFEENIKVLLKKSGVKVFSFQEIKGFRDTSEESFESNWFASDYIENNSVLFYAFVPKENADETFKKVNEFNLTLKSKSKVHISLLDIEKSN